MKKYNYDNRKKILLLLTFLVFIILLWEVYIYLYLDKNENNIFNILFSLAVIIGLLHTLDIISKNRMKWLHGLLGLCLLYFGLRYDYKIDVLFGLFLVLHNAYCLYTSCNNKYL